MSELMLALVDRDDGSRSDGVHHVHVAPAQLPLLFDETTQLVALLLLSHVVHGSDCRYRPTNRVNMAVSDTSARSTGPQGGRAPFIVLQQVPLDSEKNGIEGGPV